MPANTDAIWTRAPDIQWIGGITAANATRDLTAGTSYLVFTADATNGGYLQYIRVKNDGTATTTATVMRFWINNGSTTGTATNNILFGEMTIPAITISAVAATPELDYPMELPLPAGYRIYVTVETDPGATNLMATGVGGKY